jgi:hypothetical protein
MSSQRDKERLGKAFAACLSTLLIGLCVLPGSANYREFSASVRNLCRPALLGSLNRR